MRVESGLIRACSEREPGNAIDRVDFERQGGLGDKVG